VVISWCKVSAPVLLRTGGEARIGSGGVVGTNDTRSVNLSESLSFLSLIEVDLLHRLLDLELGNVVQYEISQLTLEPSGAGNG
jgi:hypothetical protein